MGTALTPDSLTVGIPGRGEDSFPMGLEQTAGAGTQAETPVPSSSSDVVSPPSSPGLEVKESSVICHNECCS